VRETDTVARLGGDEFAILMPAAVVGESQQRIATLDRLLNRHIVRYGNAKIAVRASIGCQAFTGRDTESDLLAGADEMMYAKKTATRKDRRG
jgi:diguanylate cyclase (GGDEF)-like protein